MNWSRRKTLAILIAVCLVSVLGTYSVLALFLPSDWPDKITVRIREPNIQLNGLRIIMFPPIDVEPGQSFQFVAATTNENGPFNGLLTITSNITGWTEDLTATTFALRLSLNGTATIPINHCPPLSTHCTYPFLVKRGINVVYGLVEIGSLAPISNFELAANLARA